MKSAFWIRKTHLFRPDAYICSRCGVSVDRPCQICPGCRSAMGESRYEPSWVDEAEGLSAILEDDW